MQRLGRLRLRHLHLPPLPGAWRRGVHRDGAAGRRRPRHLQPQGRARLGRGDEVPRLQRSQKAAGRRSRRHLFRAHRMRCRGAGCPLPGAGAGRLPLAWHPPHRSLGVDVEHEAWRGAGAGDRDCRARRPAGAAGAEGRPGRDRGEEGGGVFRAGRCAEPVPAAPHQGPPPQHVSREPGDPEYLLSAAAVRERCAIVLAAADRGETRHFRLQLDRLDDAVARIVAVTRRRYPDLDVPFHSRWRHFTAGGLDRAALIAPDADIVERARARLDLAIVSVLLDAGAGPGWQYREAETGVVVSRSEGLAVASLRAMQAGLFSADPANPWRADAAALATITAERLGRAFQHGPENPLGGLDGRAVLLRRFGRGIAAAPVVFGKPARLGSLYDLWLPQRGGLPAPEMVRLVLRAFGPIWPGRLLLGGVPLGDCSRHSAIPGDGLVPFHKLSQWLTYS